MAAKTTASASLTETAYAQLKQWIVDCDLAPGQWLTERQLSAQLSVGLSPVRGALARLDHEGLVTTSPRRGYRVTMLTLKTVDDVFTAWSVIGPALARMAAERITPEQLKKLVAISASRGKRTSRVASLAELKRSLDVGRKVFKIIAEAANNPILADAFDRLDSDMRRSYIYVYSIDPAAQAPLDSYAFDAKWEAAYRQHNGDKAAQLVSDFVARAHDIFIRTLSSSPAVMATELVMQTG